MPQNLTTDLTELPKLTPTLDFERLIELTLASYRSPHTQRLYAAVIRAYARSDLPLSRDGLREFLAVRIKAGAKPAVINQALRGVRALAKEALQQKCIDRDQFEGIMAVRYEREAGVRAGNWLTLDEARKLYLAPDRGTQEGCRDAVVLGLLLGCGLRRAEAVGLTWGKYRQREGRMCLVDIVGKGGKVRTVPVPAWARVDIDRWELMMRAEGLAGDEEVVLRGLPRGAERARKQAAEWGRVVWRGFGVGAVRDVVNRYGRECGLVEGDGELNPHDLRRTLAQLMRKAGVGLEQISRTLGHESLKVTERYLGIGLELGEGEAGVDQVEMDRGKEEDT